MNFKSLAFRFRMWILATLYILGFWAPWESILSTSRPGTLWLAASSLAARSGWMDLSTATHLVTFAALGCSLAGAALRVWGTAYLSGSVMRDPVMRGDRLVAGGPYRRLRNPLYTGTFLFSVGVSILMPPSGALFFLCALALFQRFLIAGEESFLLVRLGSAYGEYLRRVPRLMPSLTNKIPASMERARWLQAFLAEIYPVGYTLCFAVLAWRYNALILTQSLLICIGISLVTRAMWAPSRT